MTGGFVGFDPRRLDAAVGVLRRQADVVELAAEVARGCLAEAQLTDGVSRSLFGRADDWRLHAAVLEARVDDAEAFGLDVDPEVRALDGLHTAVVDWSGSENDPELDRRVAARRSAAARLVDDAGLSPTLTDRLVRLLDAGVPAGAALDALERVEHIGVAAAATGLAEADAVLVLDRVADDVDTLLADGADPAEAVGTASILAMVEVDVADAIAAANSLSVATLDAGLLLHAERLTGYGAEELLALRSFDTHFDAFDAAVTGSSDGLVSEADLRAVLDHPEEFSVAEVAAARALLAQPLLLAALDTAADHGDLMDGSRFGSSTGDDGRVSAGDLAAFVQGVRIRATLEPYRDDLDVAGYGGDVDGFFSRADVVAFADDPTLPIEVRAAAAEMLDADLFDETWLEQHRDAIAIGAGVLAGGVLIIASAGTLTAVVVAAGSSAFTTTAINRSGDAEGDWDGVASNAFTSGGLVLSLSGVGQARHVFWTGQTPAGAPVTFGQRAFAGVSLAETSAATISVTPFVGDGVQDTAGDVAATLGIVNLANPGLADDLRDIALISMVDDHPTPLVVRAANEGQLDEVLQVGPRVVAAAGSSEGGDAPGDAAHEVGGPGLGGLGFDHLRSTP